MIIANKEYLIKHYRGSKLEADLAKNLIGEWISFSSETPELAIEETERYELVKDYVSFAVANRYEKLLALLCVWASDMPRAVTNTIYDSMKIPKGDR